MKLLYKDYPNNLNLKNEFKEIKNDCSPIKIGEKNESLLNQFLYKIVEIISPIFYSLGLTPNMVTTISLIPAYLSYFYLIKRDMRCIIYYFLYMILDYIDGYMARKYKLHSKFGDIYDHGRDILFHILLLSIFYTNKKLLIIFIVFNIFGFSLFGCQEIMYEDKCKESNNTTVYWLKPFCKKNIIFNTFNYYIGTASMYLGTIICLYLYCNKKI